MIREDKFRISRRPYAVDLGSLRVKTTEPEREGQNRIHHVVLDATWFRRRGGATMACLGTLWDIVRDPAPQDVHEALTRHDDGRYGGSWVARWDGESYVSEHPQSPEAMAEHMAVLRPMLDDYPAIPAGYDGWYRFESAAERRRAREVSA